MKLPIQLEETFLFEKVQVPSLTVAIFRILLFLDGCHDFVEKVDRNKWSGQQKKVHEKLLFELLNDLEQIYSTFSNLETPELLERSRKFSNQLYNLCRNFDKIKNTDAIKKNILSKIQEVIQIKDINLNDKLKNWDCTSFSRNLTTILGENNNHNGILFGVDATKANVSFSPLFTNICDILYSSKKISIVNSLATKYDASTTSGFVKHLINMVVQKRGKIDIIGNDTQEDEVLVKIGLLELINIKYKTDNNGKVYLEINNFFGKPIKDNRQLINSDNNSVNFITSKYSIDDNIFLFKTFGDLGQVLTFYYHAQKNTNLLPIFISFDFISAVISSFFLKSTILEDTKNYISSISIFSLSPEQIDLVARLDANVDDVGTAMILTNLPNSPNQFGIKDSISNLPIKTLKERLKSVGIKVTNTIQGKRQLLTRKQLEALARKFKNLQIKAKSKGIKLKTKNGNYKSEVTLVKELEKTKTKTKNKTKSRFGS